MLVGIFADTHDHLENIRRAVERFNSERVELVLFAGDLVSTIALPPLRKISAPVVACYGDNEGNKIGLAGGFEVIGKLAEPPVELTVPDGTRFIMAHTKRQITSLQAEFDVAVTAHTHKARVTCDALNRLWINPGETSGWSFGLATVALFETTTRRVEIVDLAPR
jgi:putative phosphoesterase